MATCAPSAARRLAIAAPISSEPPLTRATFASSFLDIGFSPIPSITLFADPVSYVGRPVEKRGSSCFTRPTETNDLHIASGHLVQRQDDYRSALPCRRLHRPRLLRRRPA